VIRLFVFEHAPIEQTLRMALVGRFMCMGQVCVSSGRPYRRRNFNWLAYQVLEQINQAKALGAKGHDKNEDIAHRPSALGAKGHRMRASRIDRPGYMNQQSITDIAETNPLINEETFGPIVTFGSDSDQGAIQVANATKFGLGATIFSADEERAKRPFARNHSPKPSIRIVDLVGNREARQVFYRVSEMKS
jgi:succinate-semialdehyde dehydrogenase/glutarate-semialdehyde dehydrogenase